MMSLFKNQELMSSCTNLNQKQVVNPVQKPCCVFIGSLISIFMDLKNEDYVMVYRVWLIIVCSLLVLAENSGIIILVK